MSRFDLKGKVALVTGAGMGIGRAIALRLAADGFRVVVNDIDQASIDAVAGEIQAAGAAAVGVMADVSDREQVHAMVGTAVSHCGRLDVMVSNAGIVQVAPVMEITESDFDKLFSINLKGVIWCAQAAARQMIEQGQGGKIINAGSLASHMGPAILGTYSASKFGVRGITQTMAREFAPHGITVNAYCPGIVDTGMWDTIDSRASEVMGIARGAMLEQVQGQISLGRMQTPQDVANYVSFLASTDSDYMTGQSVIIDGGIHMN